MRLSGVCLLTNNVRALAEFYEKALGEQAQGDETHMELPGAGLAIFSLEGMEDMAPGSTAGIGCGSAVLEFEVRDAEAEYERIKALGAQIVKPLQAHPWGNKAFWFCDPDGNIVDFYQKLH